MVEGVQEEIEEEGEDKSTRDVRVERCAKHRRGKDHDQHRCRSSSMSQEERKIRV